MEPFELEACRGFNLVHLIKYIDKISHTSRPSFRILSVNFFSMPIDVFLDCCRSFIFHNGLHPFSMVFDLFIFG